MLRLPLRSTPSFISLRLLSTPPTAKTPSKSPSDLPPTPPRKLKLDLRPAPLKPPTKTPSLSPSPKPPSPKSKPSPSNSTSLTNQHADSIVELTKRDLFDATQHGILVPPPPGASWPARLWHQAKELFKFYWRGLKMVNTHRQQAWAIQRRIKAAGHPATRWETRFIRTYQQDALKLIPFVIIVLVLEEVIPLIALYAPFMLPSTCVLPSQRARIEANNAAKLVLARERFAGVFAELRAKGPEKALQALGEPKYSLALCRTLQLRAWGPAPLRVSRIKAYLTRIAQDDALLRAEGLASLSHHELVEALQERGIVTHGLDSKDLPVRLQQWLDAVNVADKGDAVTRRVAAVAMAGVQA